MHMLSAHNRSDFLATPQLIRIEYAEGMDGYEPTLLIKGTTLLLKYIVLGVRMQIVISRIKDRLLYALKVLDDESSPAFLWSIVEKEAEINGLAGIARGEPCFAFIFNELAINVAWAKLQLNVPDSLQGLMSDVTLGPADYKALKSDANAIFESQFNQSMTTNEILTIDVCVPEEWKPVQNHLITNGGTNILIELFNSNEGLQQERLAIWLTENLHPLGAHHSPQVPKGSGRRELTDLLLSHEYGSILIESKALTIFNRPSLPTREKLSNDVAHHINKAVNQLKGGIKKLRNGSEITTLSGKKLEIDRSQPAHAIVLIPDFNLITDSTLYGIEFMTEFMGKTRSFIHFLDIAELLRIVQAAEIISENSETLTALMAFDHYLMERAKLTKQAGTLCIQVILKTTT